MNMSFKDSLECLELKNGIGGVQMLMPQKRLSNIFPDALEYEHLHIVVERPAKSESSGAVAAAILITFPLWLSLVMPKKQQAPSAYKPPPPADAVGQMRFKYLEQVPPKD